MGAGSVATGVSGCSTTWMVQPPNKNDKPHKARKNMLMLRSEHASSSLSQ